MGKIVAIGGGEIKYKETFEMDRFIVEFSEKENPKLLFIPTASYDSVDYGETIKYIYGKELNCQVDILYLIDNNISEEEIKNKILSSDIIYVGGGDTVNMLKIWREKKVDKYLKEAFEKDILLSGISAGSICWFNKGDTEKTIDDNGIEIKEIPVGLNLIKAIHCPHYNSTDKELFDIEFDKKILNEKLPVIALEDNTGFVFKDNLFKIIKSDKDNKAYLLKNKNGILYKKELIENEFKTISDIL